MHARLARLCFLPLLAACGGAVNPPPPAVAVRSGAPLLPAPVAYAPVSGVSGARLLSTLAGGVAAGTASGVLAATAAAPASLSPVGVASEPGEPTSTGAIRLFARRGSGLLVVGERGLFHDGAGWLLPSPLTQSLGEEPLSALDAYGAGAAEELWLTSASGVRHLAGGQLEAVSVEGAAPPTLAIGVAQGTALLAGAGTAWLVDARAGTAAVVARDLGELYDADRGDDGTVYLATAAGLLARERSGAVTLWTFAPEGQPSPGARAVSAAYGGLVVLTAGNVVGVDKDVATALAPVARPSARGLTLDANGDTWALDGDALVRLRTGKPVSFSADVAPFLAAHCTRCHAQGLEHSPQLDLTSYEVAKGLSATLLKRLRAVDAPPMPPANIETLTAADYAVVTRWVGGGLLP